MELIATPVPKFTSNSGWSSNGWGCYATQWVYAESIDAAFKTGLKWYEDYINEQRIKQGFAKA